jgi:CheY-like chemotaxis protein
MTSFGANQSLFVGHQSSLSDQMERVAHCCGATNFLLASPRDAFSILNKNQHLDLIVVDLTSPDLDTERFMARLAQSQADNIRWTPKIGCLNFKKSLEPEEIEKARFDTWLATPMSDGLVEKAMTQVLSDAGVDPSKQDQLENLKTLIEQNQFERAERILNRGMRRFPESKTLATMKCFQLLQSGRFDEVLALGLPLLSEASNAIALRLICAVAHLERGESSNCMNLLSELESVSGSIYSNPHSPH